MPVDYTADCIQAQITADIKAALRTITAAGGFHYDVQAVEEARKELEINGRYPYILLLENEADRDSMNPLILRTLTYPVWFFTSQDDKLIGNPADASLDVDTEIAYKNRNALADITRAVTPRSVVGTNAEIIEVDPGTHDYYDAGNLILFGTWCVIRVTTNIDALDPYQLRVG